MTFENLCDGVSAVASIPAAIFWFLSARVDIPTGWDADQGKAFGEIGRLNGIAAGSAAVAALFQCMKLFATLCLGQG